MVAEPWIVKMGNHVSSNFRSAMLLEPAKKKGPKSSETTKDKQTIGILSFEVANVVSKIVHLHHSLTDSEISKLKKEILSADGVRNLVSSDEVYLLELALTEKLGELNHVASAVSRLGKRCIEPALQGFEHVYSDIVSGAIEVKELGFLVKDMDGMVRKMERYVTSTANLYSEMEVLNELEQATKKFQNNQHEESRRAFEQKVSWQKEDIRHLQDVSLWNQTYDKVVELLARTVCTVYARICLVFGDVDLKKNGTTLFQGGISQPAIDDFVKPCVDFGSEQPKFKRVHSIPNRRHSGEMGRAPMEKRWSSFKPQHVSRKNEAAPFRTEDFNFPCGTSPGRLFMECLSLSSSISILGEEDDYIDHDDRSSRISSRCSLPNSGYRREHLIRSGSFSRTHISANISADLNREPKQSKIWMSNGAGFGPRSRLSVYAPPSTVGGSSLGLHYANVIIVIEKLLRYPHLVGEEARDDLYQMLPTSLRTSLKTHLKAYLKNLAIYDAPLAHDWKETLNGILRWLAPLAHNMIRWQSERNFEQHQIGRRTNVLLLQTLYFCDREKTEAAICQLLVGLNYICRYEQQQNALLDCASSFDFEDCMEWQMQCKASFLN